MHKNLYLFISAVVIAIILSGSCGKTEIDNDIRILIKGKVVDQDDNPIVNANIQVYADDEGAGALTAPLGAGFSDETGSYGVTSLFGSNSFFYIDVFVDDQYARYRYQTSTEDYIPNDLIFDLQTVELSQIAVFNYDIIRENGNNNTLDFSFRYIDPQCLEVYNEGVLSEIESNCYQDRLLSSSLDNVNPNAENRRLMVPFQSQIEFTYSINGGQSNSEIIDINSLNYEFEFTY